MSLLLATEFTFNGILFQWENHHAQEFKYFGPTMTMRYGKTMSEQKMIDDGVFETNSNNKKLQADTIKKKSRDGMKH